MGRFSGLAPEQLVVLSFDCMGGATENTKAWLQHLIDALAAVSPEHRSVVAARVWSSVSVSLQKSLALNALQFRNGKLEAPARAVGQPGNPAQPARKQTRKRRNTSRPSSSAGSQPERSEQPASETGSDSEWHPPKSQQPAQALRGEPRGQTQHGVAVLVLPRQPQGGRRRVRDDLVSDLEPGPCWGIAPRGDARRSRIGSWQLLGETELEHTHTHTHKHFDCGDA